MSRERTLTIAGGLVALGMAGLLSLTAVNGRWLGVPSRYTKEGVAVKHLERELRGLVPPQAHYRERQRRYTTELAELDFFPRDSRITVTVQAADHEGWTAVATSREAGIGCVMRVGIGPGATASVKSFLQNLDWNLERLETCEVSDFPAATASILETQAGQR